MVRSILLSVLLLWSAVRLPAQTPVSRVVLDSGEVVVGRVVAMDAEELHLETAQGARQKLALSHVLRIERADRGQQPTPATTALPAVQRPEPVPNEPGLDHHLESFLHRYAWLIPTHARSRATLGALLFLVMASVIQLAARMIELSRREYGRCCAMALILFALMTVHTAFPVLESSQWLAVAICADLLVWFLSLRLIFGATAYEGVVMMVFCLFAGVVGLLSIEVAGWVLEIPRT